MSAGKHTKKQKGGGTREVACEFWKCKNSSGKCKNKGDLFKVVAKASGKLFAHLKTLQLQRVDAHKAPVKRYRLGAGRRRPGPPPCPLKPEDMDDVSEADDDDGGSDDDDAEEEEAEGGADGTAAGAGPSAGVGSSAGAGPRQLSEEERARVQA